MFGTKKKSYEPLWFCFHGDNQWYKWSQNLLDNHKMSDVCGQGISTSGQSKPSRLVRGDQAVHSRVICRFRGSSPRPRLLHGRRGVAGEERHLSPPLLHVPHWQALHQVRLLVPMAQSSAALLSLDPPGKPQGQDGQYHGFWRQVGFLLGELHIVLNIYDLPDDYRLSLKNVLFRVLCKLICIFYHEMCQCALVHTLTSNVSLCQVTCPVFNERYQGLSFVEDLHGHWSPPIIAPFLLHLL